MLIYLNERELCTIKAALALYGTELSESGPQNLPHYYLEMATNFNQITMLNDEEVWMLIEMIKNHKKEVEAE